MPLSLRHGVHCCVDEGTAIFLDVRRDRYFDAGGAIGRVLAKIDGNAELSTSDIACLEPLVRAGMLEPSDHWFALPASRAVAAQWAPTLGAYPALVAAALGRQLSTAFTLRAGSLETALASIRRRKAEIRRQASTIATERTLAAFAASNRVVSAHQRCLVKSIALTHALLGLGIKADLILAVRSRPFAAHAWVQIDQTVVTDTLDHIRRYSPILTI